MQKKIRRIIDRNRKNLVQINSFFNERGMEDWFIRDRPERMFLEDESLANEGLILSIHYEKAMFTFCERDYVFHVDEFKNYISLGSRKHEDHYIVIEFIKTGIE